MNLERCPECGRVGDDHFKTCTRRNLVSQIPPPPQSVPCKECGARDGHLMDCKLAKEEIIRLRSEREKQKETTVPPAPPPGQEENPLRHMSALQLQQEMNELSAQIQMNLSQIARYKAQQFLVANAILTLEKLKGT